MPNETKGLPMALLKQKNLQAKDKQGTNQANGIKASCKC